MYVHAAIDLPAPPAQVAALLADPAVVRASLAGDLAAQVEVTGLPAGPFTVTIRRTMPTEDLPAQLRGLLTAGLDVRQANAWDSPAADGARRGTIAVEIIGAPVRLAGTIELVPTAGGSRIAYEAEVKALIPLFAGQIESAVVNVVNTAVAAERTALLAQLGAAA